MIRKSVWVLLSVFLFMGIAMAAPGQKTIKQPLNPLYMPAGNTILGNPHGSITVVEFFDYNCGYCRMIYPKLQQLIQEDKDLRIIFREYPVLSPRSVLPAKAALAAQMQHKYMALHDVMMDASLPLDQSEITKLARQVGIDTPLLLKDMQSPAVMQQLQENLQIGEQMNLQGVPSFIVTRTTPPSKQPPEAMVGPSFSQLKEMIAKVQHA